MADIIFITVYILTLPLIIWVIGFIVCLNITEAKPGHEVTNEEVKIFAIWPLWLLIIGPIRLTRFVWTQLKKEFLKAIK